MAHYLDENELKEEVLNIQKTQKIRSLLVDYNNLKQYARYKREKQELRNIKREIIALYRVGANPEYSTNKFGGMIMLLLQRIASKSNFSGYSWREEFYGDATEKIFKYLHNFNPDLISKISGEPVKAFAYLTQIATMSFLSIINKYNDELACVKNFIPMMEFNEKIDKGLLYSKSDIEEDNTINYSYVIDIRHFENPPYVYNNMEYNNVLHILTELKEKGAKSIKVIMHKNNILSLIECNEILKLKFEPLNLTRYVPKNAFPAKKKKERISLEDGWLNLIDTAFEDCIDEAIDKVNNGEAFNEL
jgi:hypothetical protein